MGFLDEYKKALEEERKKKKTSTTTKGTSATVKKDSDFMEEYRSSLAEYRQAADIAPVSPTVSPTVITRSSKQDDRKWFEKGAFDDGYQFGDVTKTILGSTKDVAENLWTGIVGMGEKTVDALAYIAPYAMKAQYNGADALPLDPKTQKVVDDAFEQSKKGSAKFISKDLYDEEKVAKWLVNHSVTGNASRQLGVDSETDSVFGEKSDALVQSAGQLAATYGLSAVGVPWFVTTGVTSFGSEVENAVNQGASYEAAGLSATVSAGAEILSEKMFGGDLFVKGAGADLATKYLATGISNKVLRTMAKLGIDTAGEGFEEVFSQAMSNLGSSLYKEENIGEILFSEEALDEYLESFIGGAVLGGGMGGINAVQSGVKGVDYTTGLTENEQAVVDAEYKNRLAEAEEGGKKISAKEKANLYEAVIRDMDRGYISTDTIESVLGGAEYSELQSLQSEADEFKTLYETASGQLSAKQHDRLAELKGKNEAKPYETALKEARSRLSQNVLEFKSGNRLAESYRESSRRSQAYEADLSQYDAKQQAVIQKAVESGILNNTNRTHEFVDVIAKISSDKGVLFDFTNNEKLKESGFAVDGKQVNGYVTKDGITLNIDSPKAWQSTVGHEITHVLEGTEMYDAMKQTIFEYAKSKGEYDARFAALTETYKGVDADVEAELAADLVGEYLFQNEDFVTHLSTKDRNLFQKIYDEIKYLCKVVTAGSKEARELEKVKRAFEKAYRESGKAQGETKYSLGYHAGDLGKSESYAMQGKGRSTGHFGFGTYFVGDEAKISGDSTYGKRPHHSVEFDNYNLYKIRNDKDGYELHDQLRVLDGGVSQEFLDAVKADKFKASELRDEAYSRADKYDADSSDFIGSAIRAFYEVAEENGIEVSTYDEWLAEQDPDDVPQPGDSDYDFYRTDYYDYLKETLNDADSEKNSGYEDFNDAYFKLWLRFGKDNVNRALQAVVDHDAAMTESNYDTQRQSDSLATVFMKALGYEGVDVSGTGLDNTTYGSVIYDLKGDDLAKKKEIGTAKYSLSDSTGRQLTTEQQEYFKDSKVRDADGNLMVMYHGTQDAGFHVFDASKSDDGTSFFFVDRNDVAASYSGTSETYAPRVWQSAEDANSFLAEMGFADSKWGYEVADNKDGTFTLYVGNGSGVAMDEIATSENLAEIYEEFCDYEGVGYGDANYKVYLNLKNPLEVDAQGRNWNNVSREYSQEVADRYHSLTAEEKAALADVAGWEEISIFRDAQKNPDTPELKSAFEKLGDANIYDMYTIVENDFAEDVIQRFAVKQMNTRDYAQRAKEQGYDGVIFRNIHDNGGYSNGSEGASTVAVAFESNQIKSVANDAPTEDSDIRYSLSRNDELMTAAENSNNLGVDLVTARQQRQIIHDFMVANAERLKLPEDIEGNTAIKNSSYDITEENTTVCIRSMAADALCDAVAEALGRPLTVQDTLRISQDLMNYTDSPECVYCYVATDRRAYREFLGSYYKQMQSAIEALQSGKNSEEVYQAFLDGRKDTKNMRNRFAMWQSIANGGRMISAKDLASEKMMQDAMRDPELAAQVKDARAYAQSASWAKKRQGYQAYNGHILKWSQARVNDLNKHYGLRFYSFSDFSPAFVLENMQQMTDAAVRGLKGLAYTKELDFVEIFAPTGANINISVFGYDNNGTVAQDGMMGADFAKAQALRSQYENVGVTFVATNDSQIEWALNQDWIDVVIPYHLVRTGQAVAKHFGYTNYTAESGDTKGANWKKGNKTTIYPSEHNNDKHTYLAALADAGLEPRFARWVNHPNYMKLVNETRRAAKDTPPMQAVFNVDAAKASLERMAKQGGYFVPIGGDYANMQEIAGEIADDIRSKHSLSDEGEIAPAYGNWNVYNRYSTAASDLRLDAPVSQTAAETKTPVPETKSVEEMFPDDLAPSVSEADDAERFASLTDEDAPPEIDAPMNIEDAHPEDEPAQVRDPFEDRVWEDAKTYPSIMEEIPELKPFFMEYAKKMLDDCANSQHGELLYNDELYYNTGGEQGFTGIKRHTSQDIEEILDGWGISWDALERGLRKIADGEAKTAIPKKLEFKINECLLHGYKDFQTGQWVEPNTAYIETLRQHEELKRLDEDRNSFYANADAYAPLPENARIPLAPATTDTMDAPIYESKEKGQVRGQTTAFPPPTPNPQVATVLTEEKAIAKEKTGIGSKLVSALVDKGMVFEKLSNKTGNHELQSKWNYALNSNTEARAQYFMEHGANGVSSLKDIMSRVNGTGKAQEFFEYLYHVHNIDRMTLADRFDNTENKPVFGETVTADVSRQKAAEYERTNPEFKEWAEDVYSYNKSLRQMLVDNGIISQETADLWQEMYPHYVPIRRVDTEGQNISVPLDTRKTGVNNPIKRATGGSSDITPLFNTMAQRTEQTFRAIARNSFGLELMNTLGATTNAQEKMSVDETIDALVQQEDALLKPGTMNSEPTFTVFDNGERVEFEITEDMYDALKPAGKLLGYRNKAVKVVGDARRNLLTVWNPVFALYRNPIKDIQDVAINSQHAAKTYANVPNAIYQMATGGRYAEEYHRNGGKSNTYFDGRNNKFKTEDNFFKKALGMPIKAIETAGEFIEEIPRLAEYIASRKSGRSVERSMLDAARVTTNFAAGGDFTKFLNSHGFTFLNASVQGAAQHVRNFREAKQEGMKGYAKVLAKYAVAGLPTIFLNSLLWDDDEEYEELSDYVKQNYYVVAKTKDGKFVRIPKGRTAAVMGELFQQMENLITGDDDVDFSTFNELFWNNIAPSNPIDNNILAPVVQTLTNKAWYGDDIVPSRLQDVPAEEQYDESTSSIAKWLGENTGTSPYKWNYLIDQYSGGAGDVFLPMLTPEAESGDDSFVGNVLAPWKKELTTDSVLNNKNPGDFYDLQDELERKANSAHATEDDTMRSMYMDAVSWDMSDLYKRKREIQNSDMTDAEKYEAVREIQEQINSLAKSGMEGYNDVSVTGLYSEVGDRRFNKDAESGKWYEIQKTNADGSANYYYQKEQEVTKALGIGYEEYWNNREEYNYAYDKPEQYALSQTVGGYQAYRGYTSALWDIKADKDENGKSISGSRKEKVIDHLNDLDADYYTKIILFKNEYNADDTYNQEIIDYLNSREDISYEQMETILKYLGFEVTSDGNIYWWGVVE